MNKKVIVGAIDFGTTFSGWAFSFLHDFEKDPTKISTNHWYSGSTLVSEKTPTCVLIKPDGRTLEAFGYDAENRYIALVGEGEHEDYYYFRRFKMALYKTLNEAVSRDITIEDNHGRSLLAIDVIAITIAYLVGHMLKVCNDQATGITMDDIRWVLTVPAIWTDSAKQFMREAADQAGIKSENLVICLEPEAASILCRHLPMVKSENKTGAHVSTIPQGSTYMIIDAGGGTIDITIHKLNENGLLEEVFSANGGGWGGSLVDEEFEKLLIDITDSAVYDEFKKQYCDDWIELLRDFEIKKKTIRPDTKNKYTIRLPLTLVQLFQQKKQKTIEEKICESKYSGKIKFQLDKMIIEPKVMQDMFSKAIQDTMNHLQKIFKNKNVKDVNTILMVGGFSESPMLKNAIKLEFPNVTIISPQDSVSAVLKGAVMYGHNPGLIAVRTLKYTYGYEAAVPFIKNLHPERMKIENEHGIQCAHGFLVYAMCNQPIRHDEKPITVIVTPQFSYQSWVTVPLYATTSDTPDFIDNSLTRIGEITMEFEDHDGDINREIELTICFESTEIRVHAKDVKTGNVVDSRIDFLG